MSQGPLVPRGKKFDNDSLGFRVKAAISFYLLVPGPMYYFYVKSSIVYSVLVQDAHHMLEHPILCKNISSQ